MQIRAGSARRNRTIPSQKGTFDCAFCMHTAPRQKRSQSCVTSQWACVVRRIYNQRHNDSSTAGKVLRFPRGAPVALSRMWLILAWFLVGASFPAMAAQQGVEQAGTVGCPCTQITAAAIMATGVDGGCVDVPPAVVFTRAGDTSVYIASRNLCAVSAPTTRNVEWTAIGNDDEFAACRAAIREAADTLGVPCDTTYTPRAEETQGFPAS